MCVSQREGSGVPSADGVAARAGENRVAGELMSRFRHLLVAMLVSALSLVAVESTSIGLASADADLGRVSDVVYSVDATAAAVHVTSTYVLSELKPDEGTRYFYFQSFNVVTEGAVTNLTVTESGKPLGFAATGTGKFQRLDITFAHPLRYTKPQTVVISYDLGGRAPRTAGDTSRVNAAYASFPVFSFGSPGASSASVVVPGTFTLDIRGAPFTQSTDGANQVAVAAAIADTDDFYAVVSARNDANLTTADLTVGSNHFQIRSWPGDGDWSTFVQQHVSSGVPQLEQLVGQPWPEPDKTVDVHEAYTPYLYGYGGWFDAQNDTIEIGEHLDDNVVYHELSHAWFNDSLFAERWINEGMAQEYASRTVAALGGTLTAPNPIDLTAAGAISLGTWSTPASDHADAAEAFGYNASWKVIRSITDEIGLAKMRLVVAAAEKHTPVYSAGQADATAISGSTNWKQFLDLVDVIGGATTADAQFNDSVANADQQSLLTARAAARIAYASLITNEAAPTPTAQRWTTPAIVQTSMESWSFDEAMSTIAQSNSVLGLVAKIANIPIEGEAPDFSSIRQAYGSASSRSQLAAVVTAAQHQLDGRTATAAAITAKIAADKSAAAAKLAADTAAARSAVAAALDKRRHADGLFTRVGMWGSDVDVHIEAAQRAMDTGQFDVVTAEATAASERVSDAEGIGRRRAGLAGGGFVVLIGALLGLIVVIRRRHLRPAADVDDEIEAHEAHGDGEMAGRSPWEPAPSAPWQSAPSTTSLPGPGRMPAAD